MPLVPKLVLRLACTLRGAALSGAAAIAIAGCGKWSGAALADDVTPSGHAAAVIAAAVPVARSEPGTGAAIGAAVAAGGATHDRACPDGMVLVEGEYCPEVEQKCLRWLDPPGDRYAFFRCAEYAKPAVCKSARVHERFCIDEKERVEPGTDIPMNGKSWTAARDVCREGGARLCMTSEWQFACEGEEMRPYPYGWERDGAVCNVDIGHGLGRVGRLVDHRTPASAHPQCVSPFGVHDMAGNVDEWATVDGAPRGRREVMKGSWWLPGRHACRSFQGGHGPFYGGTESGVRCCKDAAPSP